MGNSAEAQPSTQPSLQPSPQRVDLRTSQCFPYAPPHDQGDEVSCVAQAFSAALYCAHISAGRGSLTNNGAWFPDTASLYAHALRESPDASRGVSFGSVVSKIRLLYGHELESIDSVMQALPNEVEAVRSALRRGSAVVAGYQVNEQIDSFHHSSAAREAHGLLLPSFRHSPLPISAHAVLIIGYDDSVGCFIARNSWGIEWGEAGHFLIRYKDLEDDDSFTDLVSVGFA
jgi:hypothetical protein